MNRTQDSTELPMKADCKPTKVEHTIAGKKFVVIRHFVGDKDLQGLVMDLAVNRAKREMGL